jgi:hypothetical protein
MQQPVGARQAAIPIKLLFQEALGVDRAKRHHPVPLQLRAGGKPLLQPRRRRGIDPRPPSRTARRKVTQSRFKSG